MIITLQLTSRAFINTNNFVKRLLVSINTFRYSYRYIDLEDEIQTAINALETTFSADIIKIVTNDDNDEFSITAISAGQPTTIKFADMDSCLVGMIQSLVDKVVILID